MADAELSKSPDRIAGMFDAIAGRYDLLNHLLSAGIDRRWRRRAIRGLALTGGECIVDVCSGTADLAIEARTATPGAARVLGVDFSARMLETGAQKLRRLGLDRAIGLVRGDATQLPVADEAADGVTVAFGIRNVVNVRAACDEMRRVLRPGGRVAVLELAIPTSPLIRSVYLWYFRHVLPAIGNLISRHNAAYAYLPASVGAFVTPNEFAAVLRQSGFADVHADSLTFGIAFLYTARKAEVV